MLAMASLRCCQAGEPRAQRQIEPLAPGRLASAGLSPIGYNQRRDLVGIGSEQIDFEAFPHLSPPTSRLDFWLGGTGLAVKREQSSICYRPVSRARVGRAAWRDPVLSVLCALVSVWRSWVLIPGRSCGEQLPLGQGGRATKLVFLTTDEMTFGKEVVGDIGVDGGELL